jgi:hypothetical protein
MAEHLGDDMKIPVQNAPHIIEHFWEMATRYRGYHAEYLEKAREATDPETREMWERIAEGELKISRACQSDADDLLVKFEALGGSYEGKRPEERLQ